MIQKTYQIFKLEELEKALDEVCAVLGEGEKRYSEVFVSVLSSGYSKLQMEEALSLMRERIPGVKHAGISIFRLNDDAENTFMKCSFLLFETSHVCVACASEQCDDMEEAAAKIQNAMQNTKDLAGVLLYPSGTSIQISRLMERISEGYEDVPFFGAMANTASMGDINEHLYMIGENIHTYGVTAVLFSGKELNIQTDYVLGWKPIGKEMEIEVLEDAKYGDTAIKTIDGIEAVGIYEKYLGVKPCANLVFNVCEFPVYVERNGCPMARVPFRFDEDGTLYLIGDFRKGEKLRFSYGNRAEILKAAEEGSGRMKEFCPQAMLLFVCGNRTIFLKDEADTELNYYKKVLPEMMYCHGMCELYRYQKKGGVLNSALVSIGMREGGASCRIHCMPGTDREDGEKAFPEWLPLEDRLINFLGAMTREYLEMVQEAEAANNAKSSFLSNMSHEIRTPINAVLGMDEMILRDTKEAETKGYAADIYTAGRTLLSLINDILDLSKIESGKMEIVPVEYDLSSMIHDLWNMVSVRAKEKNLKLECVVDSSLPARLYGDDIRIKQILTNILTNAVKYTKEGTVWLRVKREENREYEGGGQRQSVTLHFEVEDTGIGIKEEDMPKLFEKFQRIEEKRNRRIEGTGLGMSITVRLLSMMGSRLFVDSVYERGSKFSFDLKQQVVDGTPIGDFNQRIKSLSENYRYEQILYAPDAEILVVDDNEMNLKVFKSLLKPTGIKIDGAKSGGECLDLVKTKRYDMIFLDHMMPDMDGIETLHHMKELSRYPNDNTPVFCLTANAVSGAAEMYRREGFDGFLAKPVSGAKLEKTLMKNLPQELLKPLSEIPEEAGEENEMYKDRKAKTGGNGKGMDSAGENVAESGNVSHVEALARENPEEILEQLPAVDGLDWNFAWLHLPSMDLLEESVKGFYDVISLQADKLKEAYGRLSDEKALGDYRIQVHGMKSAAATVGIIPLAGTANVLEYAARDKRIDKIHAMHEAFMEEWLSYREKLKGVFGIGTGAGERASAKEMEPEMVRAYLEMLKNALDDFDVDIADKTMKELLEYRYTEEMEEKILRLKSLVADLDTDQAMTLIGEMEEGIGSI